MYFNGMVPLPLDARCVYTLKAKIFFDLFCLFLDFFFAFAPTSAG